MQTVITINAVIMALFFVEHIMQTVNSSMWRWRC